MLDPKDLYELVDDVPELDRPVLVHAMPGFMDAGSAGRLAAEHLLDTLEHSVVARFDHDQVLDYRGRRPALVFAEDHYERYAAPSIALHRIVDAEGTPFLLLSGPEPDYQWDRMVAAVTRLVEQLGVRLSVGLLAIPMTVPHTRPTTVTMHATRSDLVTVPNPWVGEMQVPASVGALLELRLGEAGHDALGFAAHVPHYLAQSEYPAAARTLLDSTAAATGLMLPTAELTAAAEQTRGAIDEQVRESDEVKQVVGALERQYDALIGTARRALAPGSTPLPSADEIGEELESFLAGLEESGEPRDSADDRYPGDDRHPGDDRSDGGPGPRG